MNSKSGKSQRIRHNYTKIILLTAALVLIAGVVAGLLFLHFSGVTAPAEQDSGSTTTGAETQNGDQSDQNTASGTTNSPAAPPSDAAASPSEAADPTIDPSKYDQYWMTDADFKKVYPLSLIDGEHPAKGSSTANAVNIYNDRAEKHYSLQLTGSGIQLDEQALAALVELNKKVNEQNSNYQLLVVRGLEPDPEKNGCTSADKTDHAAGFAVDFRFWKIDKKASISLNDTTLTELSKFLVEEAAKLGFIRSAGSEHFRYVGAPHALYMFKNGLTFAQYLEEIGKTNVNSPLELTDAKGEIYKLYYVKVKADKTKIDVPKSAISYTIQPDNVGGYIVTFDTGEKAASEPTTETAAGENASPEN